MASAIIEASPPATPLAKPNEWFKGLTPKERDFVEHYYRFRNGTQAYTHAYDTNGNYDTRCNGGKEVLRRPKVQEALKLRYQLGAEAATVDTAWLLQHFLSIAMADPRELIGLKVGCCRYCYGEGNRYQWREREYLEALEEAERLAATDPGNKNIRYPDPAGGFGFNATLPPLEDCPQCHGEGLERFVPRDTDNLSDQALLLYGGVKVKKDGYEIVIADRGKAAELAGRIMGAFTDKLKISGVVGQMHAIADLRQVDPQEAAKVYRDFVAGHLAG